MNITAALAALAPYGVTSIKEIEGTNMTPAWRITANGKVSSYCVTLERLVWGLTPESAEN